MDDIDREYPRRRRSRDIPPDRASDLPPRSRPLPNYDRQERDTPRRNYGSRSQRNTDYLRDRHVPPYDDDEDEYEPRPRKRQRPRRKRSFLPAFLAGCTTAIICIVLAAAAFVFYTLRLMPGNTPLHIPGLPGMHTFTQNTTQQVTLNSLTQLQVCDKIGNISVAVDPQAQTNQATVTTKKIVQATSQNDANQAFKKIIVEVQPPATIQHPLTCSHFATASASSQQPETTLTVNTTIPNSNDISSDNSNGIDITITLPSTILQSGPDRTITVESSVGNIAVNNLTGLFSIRGSTGNVTIQNAYLTPGSDIETGQGNITLNGRLITPTPSSTNQQSYFRFSSEKGNIDVTLPDTTNVTLDASTNSGTIKSDFNNQIQTNGGGASIQGPLSASAGTPNSSLVINVSLGNITLHKA
jgi:hypothetical protein